MELDAIRESLAKRVAALEAENADLIAALSFLCLSCDTGMRNPDGTQQGVRTPERHIVVAANGTLQKAVANSRGRQS